jgi:peptide subunit release factor 1 (eRF1)
MTEATPGDVQVLLDHPRGEGMVVSCYADTSLAAGFQSLWPQHLKNEVARIEHQLADDHQARLRFERDIQAVRRTLEDPAVHKVPGVAVFSASDRGLFHVFALGMRVKNRLVLDEQPYVVPLLEAMHRQRRYLVVLTDSHRGRLYQVGWGRTHLIREIDEPVPRRQRSAGERWGKQQATIARHREDHLLHYRKELARGIEQAWPDAPFRGLILLGDDETIKAVRDRLPSGLVNRIVHTAPRSWRRKQPGVDATVRAVLQKALRAHDAELTEDLERRLRERHLIAAGPQEVINALRNGQVGYPGYLVLESDRGDTATRCAGCSSVFAATHDVCPFCQRRCEKVNLWQEILSLAARHGVTTHFVDDSAELSRHGGIAAVLSRQEPWELAEVSSLKSEVSS